MESPYVVLWMDCLAPSNQNWVMSRILFVMVEAQGMSRIFSNIHSLCYEFAVKNLEMKKEAEKLPPAV